MGVRRPITHKDKADEKQIQEIQRQILNNEYLKIL